MRKSVTVTVEGYTASWWLPNGHKKVYDGAAPSAGALNRIGLERTENYKVKYSLDPNGPLVFSGEDSFVPDVRKVNDYYSDYVDVCFLKRSGWERGTRLRREVYPL